MTWMCLRGKYCKLSWSVGWRFTWAWSRGCVNGELESDGRVLHSEGPEVRGLQGAESKMLTRPSRRGLLRWQEPGPGRWQRGWGWRSSGWWCHSPRGVPRRWCRSKRGRPGPRGERDGLRSRRCCGCSWGHWGCSYYTMLKNQLTEMENEMSCKDKIIEELRSVLLQLKKK